MRRPGALISKANKKPPADTPNVVIECPFDEAFYLTRYPDIALAGLDAHQHFLNWGWREGRSPHPTVDVEQWWAAQPPTTSETPPEDVLAAIRQEAKSRAAAGDAPAVVIECPFDEAFYLTRYPDVALAGLDAHEHFLNWGWREGRSPHPTVDVEGWWARQPFTETETTPEDVLAAIRQEAKSRAAAGDAPAVVIECPFDATFYLTRYPDIALTDVDAYEHFLSWGWREGRSPHPTVDVEQWWARRPFTESEIAPDVVLAAVLRDAQDGAAKARVQAAVLARSTDGVPSDPDSPDDISLEPYLKAMSQAELVTFDCWDTLLARRMHPDYVKIIGARTLMRSEAIDPTVLTTPDSGIAPTMPSEWGLFRLRCEVEGTLALTPECDRCQPLGQVHEFRHEEVIAAWIDRIGYPLADSDKKQLVDDVIAAELQYELATTYAKRVGYRLFEAATAAGIPVAVLSDTYYSAITTRRLLVKNGFILPVSRIFASSEHDRSKREGGLFPLARTMLGVDPGGHVHIGDSVEADAFHHESQGGVALLVPARKHAFPMTVGTAAQDAVHDHRQTGSQFGAGRDQQMLIRWSKSEDAGFERLAAEAEGRLYWDGYSLGPALASLLERAYQAAAAAGGSTIYFVSREGVLFSDIAAQAARAGLFDRRFTPRHLAASRLSTFLPSLGPEPADLMRLWTQYSTQSPQQFWTSLGMPSAPDAMQRFEVHGLVWDEPVQYPWRYKPFMAAVDELWPTIQTAAVNTRSGLVTYLMSIGFQSEPTPILVDLGWRGTIQDNLSRVSGRSTQGVYFGLFRLLNPQVNVTKIGVAFNENIEPLPAGSPLRAVAPLERVLMPAVESCIGYTPDGCPTFQPETGLGLAGVAPSAAFQAGVSAGALDMLGNFRAWGVSQSELSAIAAESAAQFLGTAPAASVALYLSLQHEETFGVGRAASFEEQLAHWPAARPPLT